MFLFSFCIWHFARPTYQGFSSYKTFLSISFQFKAEKPKLQAPRLYNSGNDDSLKYLLIFKDLLGYLHTPLPLLLPSVGDGPVVLGLQRLVVRQLHRRDQVLPEQLQTGKIRIDGETRCFVKNPKAKLQVLEVESAGDGRGMEFKTSDQPRLGIKTQN